jgi:protein-tyrosine phosphatase
MGGMDPIYKDHFTYKVLNIKDSPKQNLSTCFPDVIRWISNAIRGGGSVFIHCWAGISRSPALAMAYLI